MSLKNIVGSNNWGKLVAIDPASHSLAWAVIDNEKNVIATGKIDHKKEKTEYEKFAKIAVGIENVIK